VRGECVHRFSTLEIDLVFAWFAGGAGIGEAVAKAFSELGHPLLLLARRK
jgi:hypothetical protein